MRRNKSHLRKKRSPSKERELREVLAAIDKAIERERGEFRSMVESLRSAAPTLRAEGCLRFWGDRLAEWGDHEAVVYLVSRGNPSSAIIRSIQVNWRRAENASIERFVGTEIADKSIAKSIRENPTDFMFRFWNFFDSQELSIDATMIRTAEWCHIRGYERWWRAVDKALRESAFYGGVNLFSLFNYARSDYCIQNMCHALQLSLDSIETLALPRSVPWWRTDGNLDCAIHEASAIIFARARIQTDGQTSPLIDRAVTDLRKFFDHDVAPFSYPIGIRDWAVVMPSWAVGAAIRGAEPSVERSVADRRAAA